MKAKIKAAPDTKSKVVALSQNIFFEFPQFLFNERLVPAIKKTEN
jgi:hypothetical protein